jgi:hypothetical protein
MDTEREKLIRRIWREKGQRFWNPATHGLGRPLEIDGLTFRITIVSQYGRTVPAVECEGVIVDRSP